MIDREIESAKHNIEEAMKLPQSKERDNFIKNLREELKRLENERRKSEK